MKNKYIVINEKGQLKDPMKFLESRDCFGDFKVFIKREMGIQDLESSNEKPAYLSYAKSFGFNWEPNADAGFIQYDYRADLIMRLVKEYARKLVHNIGFPVFEVRGSNIFDMSHPVVGAYAKLYGSRLFQFKSGKNDVVMSYDASYSQFNLAGKYQISQNNLPYAHFSISDCYRHEQRGECMLLYRARRFFMPDLHPYFKDVNEAFEWYPKIEKQIVSAAKSDGHEYHVIAEVGSDKFWNKYREKIVSIAKMANKPILVKILRDNMPRYWIINVDYKIVDKLGQSREIACIQIDIGNAKRLGIQYLDKSGKLRNPVIIHSAIPGGIERYLYMLFDGFEEGFPLWLYPSQIRLLPISKKLNKFCLELRKKYSNLPIRIDIDDRDESVSKKVKQAHLDFIPFNFVIGDIEAKGEGNISKIEAAIEGIVKKCKGKPFISAGWPALFSKQAR